MNLITRKKLYALEKKCEECLEVKNIIHFKRKFGGQKFSRVCIKCEEKNRARNQSKSYE